jgi:hypothetical protein
MRLLDARNGISCLQPAEVLSCPPRYWARDYTGQMGSRQNCSGTPAPSRTPLTPGICDGRVVYILTYGFAMREQASAWRESWIGLGASVPPIEDVLRTSRRAGRAPPTGYLVPTVLIDEEESRACANALIQGGSLSDGRKWNVEIKTSPRSSKPPQGAIEVWLPRNRDSAAR